MTTARHRTTTATGNKPTGCTTMARGGTATDGMMAARAAGQQGDGQYNNDIGRHDNMAR